MIYSVLFLILTFFNGSILFLILGMDFIALIFLLIYLGAVAVLFVFVVMMIPQKESTSIRYPYLFLTLPIFLVSIYNLVGLGLF